ncbi:MAG: hypothetical protein WAW96_22010 [Alphaproteobacteria bacterium]
MTTDRTYVEHPIFGATQAVPEAHTHFGRFTGDSLLQQGVSTKAIEASRERPFIRAQEAVQYAAQPAREAPALATGPNVDRFNFAQYPEHPLLDSDTVRL